MNHRTFRILIAVVLVLFVVVTLTFQSICAPDKNPVSAAVSSYVEKTIAAPAPQRVDPLSYDGVKKVIVRWVSQYCKRCPTRHIVNTLYRTHTLQFLA